VFKAVTFIQHVCHCEAVTHTSFGKSVYIQVSLGLRIVSSFWPLLYAWHLIAYCISLHLGGYEYTHAWGNESSYL